MNAEEPHEGSAEVDTPAKYSMLRRDELIIHGYWTGRLMIDHTVALIACRVVSPIGIDADNRRLMLSTSLTIEHCLLSLISSITAVVNLLDF